MAKHEPWFKPRADEDADEELVNWLGGRSNPPPKQSNSSGWGCFSVAPAAGVIVALLVVVAPWVTLSSSLPPRGTTGRRVSLLRHPPARTTPVRQP